MQSGNETELSLPPPTPYIMILDKVIKEALVLPVRKTGTHHYTVPWVDCQTRILLVMLLLLLLLLRSYQDSIVATPGKN